jgi:hypothetical protein
MNTGLSPTEENRLIELLAKMQQPWSEKIYNALAAKVRFTAIEVVMLKQCLGNIHVLMTMRPCDDPFYAHLWHSPGSMSRDCDGEGQSVFGIENALVRIYDEVGLARKDFAYLNFVEFAFIQTPRGPETSLIFCCRLPDSVTNSPAAQWFDCDNLPHDTVGHHKHLVIPVAVKFFERNFMH